MEIKMETPEKKKRKLKAEIPPDSSISLGTC